MKKKIEKKPCKNCIHYRMCVDKFRKAKQDGEVLLIEEEAYFADAGDCDFYADKRVCRKQEWISVEERLPENDYDKHWKDRKRYLVFTEPCGIMFVATYGYKEHDWWVNGDHLVLEKRNHREVTHWMPLPSAPKGE